MALKTTALTDNLNANRSTTSTTFVAVIDSNILFTPTYSKMRVTVTILGQNNNSSETLIVGIRAGGVSGNEPARTRIQSTNSIASRASDVWDVPPGVELTLELEFRVSGGTGTISASSNIVWEIIEYD